MSFPDVAAPEIRSLKLNAAAPLKLINSTPFADVLSIVVTLDASLRFVNTIAVSVLETA